jgi:hypothetical protein
MDERETRIVPIDLGNNLTIHVEATDLGGREQVAELPPPSHGGIDRCGRGGRQAAGQKP